jgi:hypothetical protein
MKRIVMIIICLGLVALCLSVDGQTTGKPHNTKPKKKGMRCARYSGTWCTYTSPFPEFCPGNPFTGLGCPSVQCARVVEGPSHHDRCVVSSNPNDACELKTDGYCVKLEYGICHLGMTTACVCDVNMVVGGPYYFVAGRRAYCQ